MSRCRCRSRDSLVEPLVDATLVRSRPTISAFAVHAWTVDDPIEMELSWSPAGVDANHGRRSTERCWSRCWSGNWIRKKDQFGEATFSAGEVRGGLTVRSGTLWISRVRSARASCRDSRLSSCAACACWFALDMRSAV